MDAWREESRRLLRESMEELDEEFRILERLMQDFNMLFGGQPEERPRQPRRKRRTKFRNQVRGHGILWEDYFIENPTYFPDDFRRSFRMSLPLFQRLLREIPQCDEYFVQRRDAANVLGLSAAQKLTSAVRQLAYWVSADATDVIEYCRIGESTARESLYRFCRAVRETYSEKYLRKPTTADFERVLKVNAERGMSGMFGSLDCMHYKWTNCPVGWQGAFSNKDGKKTIVLEAVADDELWIWHSFFGLPGANNDLNILARSPLLYNLIHGGYQEHQFLLNGQTFKGPYLLVDGIYPKYSCFVQTIAELQSEKTKHFAKVQESIHKDVECAFGVLQSCWHIIMHVARLHGLDKITDILQACVILHNMIVEDERGQDLEDLFIGDDWILATVSEESLPWNEYLGAVAAMQNRDSQYVLRDALIEHLWVADGSRCVW